MRDHFEGTPLDMTTDIGAGGNALPYRWRPMGFEYKGWSYVNERAIATQQTGFWFVGQSRHDLPDVVGGVIWFGTDDAATSYLTPIYTCTDKVPECFRVGNGNMLKYSPTASFWINNRVATCSHKYIHLLASFLTYEILQQSGHESRTYILECQCRTVEEFEAVDVISDGSDRAIKCQCVIHNATKVGIGNILAKESLCHCEGDVLE